MNEIAEGVYFIGVDDTKTDLFEGLWPLPEGVSYNSYIVKGTNKIAVIDTVKNIFATEYLKRVEEIISFDKIDYIILNHMEPDHSGALPNIAEKAPQAEIVCTSKAAPMIHHLYEMKNKIRIVKDGESIDLGERKLIFTETPLVHWPETMMTYDDKSQALFSGDAFGGFKTICGEVCDDFINTAEYEDEILRYFSNIVAKYTKFVLKAIDKLRDVKVRMICPTHGIIWRENPKYIIDKYIEYSKMEGKEGITLIYGSMYGNTTKLVDLVEQIAKEKDISIITHDASRTDISFLIKDSWKNRGILLAYPTYDAGIFPKLANYIDIITKKKLDNRVVGFFGSSLWSGRALEKGAKQLEEHGWDVVRPIVEFRGKPEKEDQERLRQLMEEMIIRIRNTEE